VNTILGDNVYLAFSIVYLIWDYRTLIAHQWYLSLFEQIPSPWSQQTNLFTTHKREAGAWWSSRSQKRYDVQL